MEDIKSRVEKLRSELYEFVRSVIKSESFDIVIPIVRKGLFILKTAELDPNPRYQVHLLPLKESINLRGKSVLIFDNSCHSGLTLFGALKELEANHLEDEHTRIGVFVKCRSCNVPIDFFKYEVEEGEYEKFIAILSDYLDSLCHQLDADHLVLNTRILSSSVWDKKKYSSFLSFIEKILRRYGGFYYQKSTCELWGRKKFAVYDLSAIEFGLKKLSYFWKEEGVFKVRFCLEPDGRFYIVPIFCPETITNKSFCKGLLPWKLCELFDLDECETSCRDCTAFNLHNLFFKNFFKKLRNDLKGSDYDILIESSTWSELELRYENFRKKILNESSQIYS